MAALRMKHNSGGARRRGSPKPLEAPGKKKVLLDDGGGGLLALQGQAEEARAPFERPKRLTKRQARRLDQEEANVLSAPASPSPSSSSSSAKRSKRKLSKKQARQKGRLEAYAGEGGGGNQASFKGPSAPDPDKKIGRSGNIAYGGHGEEWRNTAFSKRLGNNHMLRVKREQAARLRQLERQDAPASALSGKAKKHMLKEKRARKREQKRLKAAAEEEEAAAAAELAMQAARVSNLELGNGSSVSRDVAPSPAVSSFIARVGASMAKGMPTPTGKQLMYECFLADVAASVPANANIPERSAQRTPRTLRAVTFNVHFFQRGYSGEEHGDNRACINRIVRRLNPDVIFLQEVVAVGESGEGGGGGSAPATTVADAASIQAVFDPALGYDFTTFALASDNHVLPDSVRCAPGQRLAVAIASRIPLQACSSVALGGGTHGYAASAVLHLENEGLRIGLYTAHLSVRCASPETTRCEEIRTVVAHAESALAAARIDECLLGGDFNQPFCRDYAPDVWKVMAQDMENAGLPLSDGVAELLRDGGEDGGGVWVTSFDDAGYETPPISAWNGATVDFMYRRQKKQQQNKHHKKENNSMTQAPTFRCTGSWMWYGGGDSGEPPSDHLPLVCDYAWG
jgi:endonuclease/exonuclease/phosphatase family metal-dependent hydrolase